MNSNQSIIRPQSTAATPLSCAVTEPDRTSACARWGSALVILAIAILTIAAAWTDAAFATSPGQNGKIGFYTNRDGNYEIYMMDGDGSNPTNLTNHPADDLSPAWSPDGRKIAFSSNRGGGIYDIYVMNADGSNVTKLTNGLDAGAPAWSPDGTKIAFTRSVSPSTRQMWVMNANGTNQTDLSNNTAVSDDDPTWSPDGTKIAFARSDPAGSTFTDIWVMDANGQNKTRITFHGPFLTQQPDWSPDGTQIVFNIYSEATTYDVFVMDTNGSNQVQRTNHPALDAYQRWSPDASKIAFVSSRDGPYRIYVMNADGSNQTRITHNVASDYADFLGYWQPLQPVQIAFVFNQDGNPCSLGDPCADEIYLMNPDGTNQVRLTNNSARDSEPSFSPAGNRIAFVSTRDGNDEIYIMNANGSGQTRLTVGLANDLNPTFSPDGTKIAFTSTRDSNGEIYIMNVDGSNQTNLTNSPLRDRWPSFSPDGTKIVFASNRDSDPSVWGQEGPDEIYVMNANGSNPTRLTNNPERDTEPAFSPDGSKIAFVSRRDNNYEIYVMNADGSSQMNLTNNPAADDVNPVWSPDGIEIAFLSNRDGSVQVYVMNADGSGQTRLTNNPPASFPLSDMTKHLSWGGRSAHTPAGANVEVSPSDQTGATPVLLAFSNVTQDGYTNLTTSTSGPAVPAGFALSSNPPVYHDITTTATFTGNVEVCIQYDGTGIADESQLTLVHYESGQWVDRTSSRDPGADIICGTVTSLSPFAILKPTTFQFTGFFQPVDNPGPGPTFVFNKVKAGLAVPVKFSLNGNQGLNIFAATYPKSANVSCSAASALDTIEVTVTAGQSGLSYDAATDRYTYTWKTDKAWSGSCRKLTIRLVDGTDHVAYFSFTK